MNVAITGGTGFLGCYVAEAIKSVGSNPIIFTRRKVNNVLNSISRHTDYSLSNLEDNLCDIDAVIHLAATRGNQDLISEFHDNEVLTQNLYEACYRIGIKNIVYASTISAYSNQLLLPWKEEQLPEPTLMYGVSKVSCEYIGNIYSSQKGLCIKNLRLAHLYGFNEKNNYMINLFLRQALNKEKLVLNTKSEAKREFLYAKDAAKAIVSSLRQDETIGTYNIGSGEAFTNLEVALIINKVFDNDGNIDIKNPDSQETIKSSYMESQLAKEILGYTPDYTFETSIKEIYSLMKELDNVQIYY